MLDSRSKPNPFSWNTQLMMNHTKLQFNWWLRLRSSNNIAMESGQTGRPIISISTKSLIRLDDNKRERSVWQEETREKRKIWAAFPEQCFFVDGAGDWALAWLKWAHFWIRTCHSGKLAAHSPKCQGGSLEDDMWGSSFIHSHAFSFSFCNTARQ